MNHCPGEVHGFLHRKCKRLLARRPLPRSRRGIIPGTGQKLPQSGQLQVTKIAYVPITFCIARVRPCHEHWYTVT